MLNFFAVETEPENNFFAEQVPPVLDALKREKKVEGAIYHTENKELFKYVIVTEIAADNEDNLIKTTTSIEKLRLRRDEFIEYIHDELDDRFVPEKSDSLPACGNHDELDSQTACEDCLRPIAEQHLRCIQKVERLLATTPKKIVFKKRKKSASSRALFLFLLLLLLAVSLFFIIPSPLHFKENREPFKEPVAPGAFREVVRPHPAIHKKSVLPQSQGIQPLLSVVSNVENSSITVVCRDGKKYFGVASEKTPFEVRTKSHSCKVSAEKQGFLPVNREIILTGDQSLSIHLSRLFFLKVYADMEKSDVFINGEKRGVAGDKTPATLSLLIGKYEIEVTNNKALLPFKQKVHLTDDTDLHIVLVRPALTIRFNVEDVSVKVDNKEYVPSNQKLEISLPVGEHHVSARKKGYLYIEKNITLTKNTQILLALSPVSVISSEMKDVEDVDEAEEGDVKEIRAKPIKIKIRQGRSARVPYTSPPIIGSMNNCQNEISVGMPELCN